MTIRITALAALCLLGGTLQVPIAHAQGCCSVGTSALGGPERGVIRDHTLHMDISYHFNNLDISYNGSREIDDPLQRSASVEMLGVGMEYGIARRISVMVQIGYFEKNRTITVRGDTFESQEEVDFRGRGFGDLLVLAKYRVIEPSIISPFEFSAGGGAKLPIGRYRQDVRGTRLALDLQAGTGATDLLAWAHAGYSFVPTGIGLMAWILHRYPGANLENYRYGDETLFNIGITKQVAGFLEIGIASRLRTAERDFSNGRLLQSTGGTQISLFPHLSYLSSDSVFRFFGQIPVSQNLLGIQLGLSYLIGVELGYTFDLGS